jgi:predicted GNAT family acetyltransferase
VSAAERASVLVTDVPDARRFEAYVDDELVAFVEYRLAPGVITFLHTEVLPGNEGRGVGGQVARTVLDEARARGLRVRPLCPFIAAWIRRHPEYADLVIERPVSPSP